MTKKLTINDSWVLHRAGVFSVSFSGFLSQLSESISTSLSKLDHLRNLEELGVPSFVKPLMKKVGGMLGEDFQKHIQKQVDQTMEQAQESMQKAEKQIKLAHQIGDEKTRQIEAKLDKLEEVINQRLATKLFGVEQSKLTKALFDVAKERGVTNEGILHLIQMMPEFEALLYFLNVRKFYRDHTAHSLRVAVLGDFLLDREGGTGGVEGVLQDKLELTSDEVRTAWWFTGLLHDVGYPISKLATSLNWSIINEMIRCYPSLGMQITPMQVHLAGGQIPNAAYLPLLMNGLPKKWQALIQNGLGTPDVQEDRVLHEPVSRVSKEYQPGKSTMDHGVVAAVSLLSTLGSPDQLKKNLSQDRPFIEAARAISLHNFAKDLGEVSFEEHPLIFLLILADELQEWGRPIPVTIKDSYFTTSLEKLTLLDEIFYKASTEDWDIPYIHAQAKKVARFDFHYLCKDKQDALKGLDCTEQFPESNLWLLNVEEERKRPTKFGIKISSK